MKNSSDILRDRTIQSARAAAKKTFAVGTVRREAVPRPVRRDSIYRRLMEKHDRMHSNHLGG